MVLAFRGTSSITNVNTDAMVIIPPRPVIILPNACDNLVSAMQCKSSLLQRAILTEHGALTTCEPLQFLFEFASLEIRW